MKGALGLLAIAAVVWVFWMTKVWLTKSKDSKNEKED